jgi:hypothetical protein
MARNIDLTILDKLLALAEEVIDRSAYVASWPTADMTVRDSDFRFRGYSGHRQGSVRLPLLTQSGQAIGKVASASAHDP